ncbi:hypothetical protein F5Y00DRAFT_269363 [Daldinia vernicosa]|uniref:uncharacterized protein n=1 Tax=Daldinia vernicosa TaxID=114800 RepID=UPI00200832BA|nr:uncharacterized protein F5Y00DRAFT_269363 [Daldinia vernicosa]KAI0849383.1 hypothetical protein F5Y00DRAFT_269363 [Daldinia vernicosa]
MTQSSDNAAHNGTTPPKQAHSFSENPPTSHATDSQSLREYRLDRFKNEPNSVPLASVQPDAPDKAQETRRTNLAADLNTILSEFDKSSLAK